MALPVTDAAGVHVDELRAGVVADAAALEGHGRLVQHLQVLARQADVDRLTAGYGSDDLEVRVMSVRFAGELGLSDGLSKRDEKVARDVVRLALHADEPTLREAAMKALLDLGLDGEEDVLRRNLGNEYLAVRVEAAGTLLLLAQRG